MVKLIAIVDRDFGLSRNGEISWEFSEDRRLFRKLTLNSVVIMGRNTFFSHKNIPLNNRINCVVTKESIPEVESFLSLESAIEKYPDCWIIGGAKLYNYALEKDLISDAVITQVRQSYKADSFLNVDLLQKFSQKLWISKEDYCVWRYKGKIVNSFDKVLI